MNDDELFRRLAAHAGSAEIDPGFDDGLYGLLQGQMGRSRRSTRPVLLLVAAVLLAVVLGSAVLVGSGIVELPVLPGSSGPRLAYGIEGDIYLGDWDGGNAVRVADGVAPDGGSSQCGTFSGEGSMWAPDGSHLAYRSWWNDACPGEVHVRDPEGRLVASVPGSGWDVSWSPDSTRFATWVELWRTIGIYSLGGERQALLTVPPDCAGSGDHDPRWSPDGKSVVVPSWPCEIPIDGGTPLRLPTTDPRAHFAWSYSPDGTRVAYITSTSEDDTAVDLSLVIAEASGTVLQVVREESAPIPYYHDLVWSPSGDRVLFGWTPGSEDGIGLHAASELRLVDIGTGQVTTIAAEPGVTPIRFSPEGDRILFSTWDDEGYTGLWSMDADGSHMQLLVPDTGLGDWEPFTGSD